MADRYGLTVSGHRFTLTADEEAASGRLDVDGRDLADLDLRPLRAQVRFDQLETGLDLAALGLVRGRVRVLCWRPGRVLRVALVLPPDPVAQAVSRRPAEVLDFEPPPGTRRYRWWAFQQRHPRVWAARHVLVAALQVGLLLLGLRFALPLVPWHLLPWPDWRLPRIPWPDLPRIPWPRIPLPDLPDWALPSPPEWVRTVLRNKQYWLPIAMAVVVAMTEMRRRRSTRDRSGEAPDDVSRTAGRD